MTDQDINNTSSDETQSAAQANTIQDHEIDLDTGLDTDTDDVTFEQDADTRENTAPDAVAKVAKLKAEIEKLKTEKQQYLDNWQRDKAEFVNARRRDEESKAEFLKFAVSGFAEELLPIIDSFEAALKHEGSKEGIELIYTQFKSVLKKQGIEDFGQVSDAFDPSLHQAIGNVETADKTQDHTVAEVLQKGYQIHGKVIRPAFVKVFQCA
ncbi:MAG: hypothetical protein RIQ72_494 [Candidatus Parcubacteria bacterium]|jgi:molecular chaperone GrpE